MKKTYIRGTTNKGYDLLLKLLNGQYDIKLHLKELESIKYYEVEKAKECRKEFISFLKKLKIPQDKELDDNLHKTLHEKACSYIDSIFSSIVALDKVLQRDVFK